MELAHWSATPRKHDSGSDTQGHCNMATSFDTAHNMVYTANITCQRLHKRHTHHTHTRLMALCPGLPGRASTRKVKPIWILVKQETVSGSGIGWTICKSAPRSRQITTPTPNCSVFYRPDALPATQPTVSKHWRQTDRHTHHSYIISTATVQVNLSSLDALWTWGIIDTIFSVAQQDDLPTIKESLTLMYWELWERGTASKVSHQQTQEN